MERLNTVRHYLENILFLLIAPLLGVNSYSQAWLDIKTIEKETDITNIKRAGGAFGGILKSAPIAADEQFNGRYWCALEYSSESASCTFDVGDVSLLLDGLDVKPCLAVAVDS